MGFGLMRVHTHSAGIVPQSPTSRVREARGFALIDLLFVIAIIGVIASMAMPGLIRARASAGVASAIGSLRVINSAEITYAITCGAGFYAPNLMTLGAPPPGSPAGFVSPDLGVANVVIKADYQIQVAAAGQPSAPPSCNGLAGGQGGTGYRAAADALNPTLNRFFSTNASGAIYQANASLWGATPEAGPPAFGTALQ
jgi:type II secretory pathway pseudopilin PulG